MPRVYPPSVDSVDRAAQNGLLKWTVGLQRERAHPDEGIPVLREVLFELGVILAASLTLALVADLIVMTFGAE
jgi:hypothetical protein